VFQEVNVNVRFLDTFLWVARLNSFRLTADKLFTTQASISNRIAALEEELGVKLFVRESKGVRLTPDGEKVLEYAERIVGHAHALRASLGQASGYEGKVRIGAIDSVVHTWFIELISWITEHYDHLEVEITVDSSRGLINQLQKGYLDIAFQTDPIRLESIHNLELAKYPMRWIVAAKSPYNRPFNSLQELASERLVTFVANSRPHQDILSLLHLNGITSPRVSCVNSFVAMIRLIEDGFGIGAIPPALVREQLANGSLTFINISNTHPTSLSMLSQVASWRTGPGLDHCEAIVRQAHSIVQRFCNTIGPERGIAASLHAPHVTR
jgi:DNA-binding transcriptional LysR family regulator